MKLYELTETWAAIQDMIDADNVNDEQIHAAIENIDAAIEEKAENYAKLIFSMKAEAEAIRTEEKRLATKRQSLENRAKWLQKNLENAMIITGKKKFKTNLFGFSVQKNAPSLDDFDEAIVPEAYWKVTRSIDRSALLKAVKDGEVEGIELRQTESLRIR